MTNREVMIETMAYVSGKSKDDIRAGLNVIHPYGIGKLDQLCPDAEQLLAELRKEAPGIANWAMEGLRRSRNKK